MSKTEVDELLQGVFSTWGSLYVAGDSGRLRQYTIEAVEQIKAVLRRDSTEGEEEAKNILFVAAVFLRGLLDFVDLTRMTGVKGWDSDHDAVEAVWRKFCDCRDRVGFAAPTMRGRIADFVKDSLGMLGSFFQRQFGEGLYMSAAFKSEGQICTICQEDARVCTHVPGKLYGGKLCQVKARSITPEHVGIVENPHDPRCRLWPWNFAEDKQEAWCTIMVAFRLDDFMDSDDWHETG